ncbi:hypothetical protein BSY238_3613 [Methyloversatilis sp. RAC08]|nr:hypothetical protein BSY238_3613 [Methyloversatilis sp. RAC08]
MQRDQPGPVRARRQQRLVPQLGLRPRVGEQQGGRTAIEFGQYCVKQFHAQMSGPRKAFGVRRNQAVQLHRPRDFAGDPLAARTAQHLHRMVRIAQGGRQAPHRQRRIPLAQPGQCKLRLHAALVGDQFMPFVDHHGAQRTQLFTRRLVRQHQRKAFRRGDQRLRQRARLAGAFGRTGVAGAQADIPVQTECACRVAQRQRRIRRECAHRSDPQHAQARGGLRGGPQQRPEPHRQGLARSGAGVQQAAAALLKMCPNGVLEIEHAPAAFGIKVVDAPLQRGDVGQRTTGAAGTPGRRRQRCMLALLLRPRGAQLSAE